MNKLLLIVNIILHKTCLMTYCFEMMFIYKLWCLFISFYAIKVWLSKSEKDWFLYKDL